jgi:hypothetical protein
MCFTFNTSDLDYVHFSRINFSRLFQPKYLSRYHAVFLTCVPCQGYNRILLSFSTSSAHISSASSSEGDSKSENFTRDTFLFLDIFRVLFHTYIAGLISACDISPQDGQCTRKSNTEARLWKHSCCGNKYEILCVYLSSYHQQIHLFITHLKC